MAGRMAGRRALITGGASGIGRASAALFVAEGAAVALIDRDEVALEAAAAAIGATAVPVDLLDEAAVFEAVARGAAAMGGIDVVVNCAGIAGNASLEALDRETWERFIGVNLTAPYLVCRAALPFLRERAGASIVNVASGQALLPGANASAYAASKGGLVTFTKALAAELAPGIRANAVAPGFVATPMVAPLLAHFPNPDDAPVMQNYALKRIAQPEEIAEAILFLGSDASSFVTGTVLAVDGGRTFH